MSVIKYKITKYWDWGLEIEVEEEFKQRKFVSFLQEHDCNNWLEAEMLTHQCLAEQDQAQRAPLEARKNCSPMKNKFHLPVENCCQCLH